MAQQRMALWAAEADIDEDVDLSLALGNYGQNGHYDDGEVTFIILLPRILVLIPVPSTYATTPDRRVSPHCHAATYGAAGRLFFHSGCCKSRELDF
jgi:hypothetical protein